MFHPDRVAQWNQTGDCFPLQVEIGATNSCQHFCTFCSLDWITHGKVKIDPNAMIRSLESMAKVGVKAVYFAGEGEPMLHRNMADFVEVSYENGMGVSMATNGQLLTREKAEKIIPKLSWIRFSIDAATPDTHAKIHGVNPTAYTKILDNISECVRIKKDTHSKLDIGVQAIVLPENLPEMEDFVVMFKDIGVDNVQLKPAHNHPSSQFSPDVYDFYKPGLQEKLKSHQGNGFNVVVREEGMERLSKPRIYGECFSFSFFALVDAVGDVYTCNIFYDKPEYSFGNLNENTFEEIWLSDRRKQVIERINTENIRDNHKMCGVYKCRPDVLNNYLWRIKHPEKNDEFI